MRTRPIRNELRVGSSHARLLLERLRITGSPNLYQLADMLGLKVKEADLEGCDGVLVRARV